MTPDDYTDSEIDIRNATRYVNGATDDVAEDAYFTLEHVAVSDVRHGLRILQAIAAGVERGALDRLGAGLFETFLHRCEPEDFDQVVEAIIGDARLLQALRGVRSIAIPLDLALRLSPLLS